MTDTNSPIVLDCTLRDGGYYNNWDFDVDVVDAYLKSMAAARIPFVEMGFRFTPKKGFYGPYAYSTDSFLRSLSVPEGITLGVMINAADPIKHQDGPKGAIAELFQPRAESPVDLVRIAAHFKEFEGCETITKELKALGYQVGFNLMQATERTPEELERAAKTVSDWNSVDVLYFADSLGNMEPVDVERITSLFRQGWDGPMGIHTHDNMGRALANSLAAVDCGLTWLDGTITGMGRGAGNVATESLLLELSHGNRTPYEPDALFDLAVNIFGPMKDHYRWGANLFYHLSALYGVHPTYVQQMLSNDRYSTSDIVSAIKALSEQGGLSYSGESLQDAIARDYNDSNGTWSAAGWAEGRPVLLVADASGAKRHRDAIVQFIEQAKPVVICLNHTDLIPLEHVAAFASSHPTRLLTLTDAFRASGRPLIAPLAAMPATQREQLNGIEVLDYGLEVKRGGFEIGDNGCTLPVPLVTPYAISAAAAAGASEIFFAGFDGFTSDDPRHVEMEAILAQVREKLPDMRMTALTPTTYSLAKGSVYTPVV